MFDISVYGHLTIDRIFDNFNEQRTLGAIGNFWEACMLTNPLLNINIQPLSVGEAIIYINKKTKFCKTAPNVREKWLSK